MEPNDLTKAWTQGCGPFDALRAVNEPCVASSTTATPKNLSTKNKSGHILCRDSRAMILRCYTYWRDKDRERTVEETCKFVGEMLGVSGRTVFRVRKEAQAGELSTPSRKRSRNAQKTQREV